MHVHLPGAGELHALHYDLLPDNPPITPVVPVIDRAPTELAIGQFASSPDDLRPKEAAIVDLQSYISYAQRRGRIARVAKYMRLSGRPLLIGAAAYVFFEGSPFH